GRITLNPVSHFDPLGFILMVFLALGIGLIAWGKPVPVNLYRLQGGKAGYALTALAGPASNLLIATIIVLPLRLSGVPLEGFAGLLVSQLIFINLLLAAFNMIPIPPLDGSKILSGFLPDFWFPYLARLEQYGFAILLILIIFGRFLGGGSIIFDMYQPVITMLWTNIVGSMELSGYTL
ncbi:MAG: site-2 protease family protein, partial [Chloroflexota bacterium]